MERKIPKYEWSEALEQFTQRNAGRYTSMEVNDPVIGAQRQESDFQLRGIAYDGRDDRIEIMLGELGSGPHLTHTLGDVTQLDLVTNEAGRDTLLRFAQSRSQTLLRIEQPEVSPEG